MINKKWPQDLFIKDQVKKWLRVKKFDSYKISNKMT